MSEWNLVKTRAQKKAEQNSNIRHAIDGNVRNLTLAEKRAEEDKKMIKMIKDNADKKRVKWSRLGEVEKTLKVLSSIYKRAKDSDTKKEVRGLTDKYEKQMKKLIISEAEKRKANNKQTRESTNNEVNETNDGDGDTIMSPITVKTTMSQRIQQSNEKINKQSQETNEDNKKSATNLESLGKIRKAKTTNSTEGVEATSKNKDSTNANEKKHESEISDNITLMSDITQRTINTKTPAGTQPKEVIDLAGESVNDCDDLTLMSAITKENFPPLKSETPQERKDNGPTNENTDTPHTKNGQTNNEIPNAENPQQQVIGDSAGAFTKASYLQIANYDEELKKASTKVHISSDVRTNTYIRIRFQFVGKFSKMSVNARLREVVYHTMRCVKSIDPQAGLMPWEEDENKKVLNGLEIRMHPEDDILMNYSHG